jgi:hypothetical protein
MRGRLCLGCCAGALAKTGSGSKQDGGGEYNFSHSGAFMRRKSVRRFNESFG